MCTKIFFQKVRIFLTAFVLTIGVIISSPCGVNPNPNPYLFTGGEDIDIDSEEQPFSIADQED